MENASISRWRSSTSVLSGGEQDCDDYKNETATIDGELILSSERRRYGWVPLQDQQNSREWFTQLQRTPLHSVVMQVECSEK